MSSVTIGKARTGIGKAVRWLGSRFLLALEVIGLREERPIEQEIQLAGFRQDHTEFRKLLTANSSFLECVSDLEAKLLGQEFFDSTYVKRQAIQAATLIHHMVESLNGIADNRYQELRLVLDRVTSTLTGTAESATRAAPRELVLDLSDVTWQSAELVGGKMANLAEIRNELGLPTPDGFAVTTEGYRLLVEEAGLRSWLEHEELEMASLGPTGDPGRALQERIRQSSIPVALSEAILSGYDRLSARLGRDPRVAVRSSAVGEDGPLSFAGQYTSILNVTRPPDLGEAYREVVASLYSPEAVHYRLLHKIPGDSTLMAVGFLTMVDAVASGIIFTREPTSPSNDNLLIQAVHGLGVTLVDGRTTPEQIRVARGPEPSLVSRFPAQQASRVVCEAAAGTREEVLPAPESSPPCLSDHEALQLARWALDLEAHFGGSQDIEWAIDAERNLVLLQCRPLRILTHSRPRMRPVGDAPLLLEEGEVACPGVGIGPAVHMDENSDFDSFPDGAVLVARRPSPRFVRLMKKARAIVTDFGSTTGHMASLAREFRIPALLNTKKATQAISSGTVVTVDATQGYVYAGEMPGLAEKALSEVIQPALSEGRRKSASYQFLEQTARLIVPLNLTDPRSPDFRAESCRTLHDMARFIHERSYEEMFGIGGKLGDFRALSYNLDVFLPIDLYIIDLDGGIEPPSHGKKVKLSHVRSVPLSALLRGMLDKRIPRFGPRAMDLQGLVSIMARHALTSPESEPTFRDPCYAMVSDRYLNYTARVGYHFGVVDSYCGKTANKNYISILFRGGAADLVRRQRRALAIAGILRKHGFSVEVNRDVVTARLSKQSQEEMVQHLEMVGRLLQFMRQMDVAMSSDDSIGWIQEAFISGNFRLETREQSS